MSDAHAKSYSQLIVNAWTALCALVTAIFFFMLACGPHLLAAGKAVWDLLRYLASPII